MMTIRDQEEEKIQMLKSKYYKIMHTQNISRRNCYYMNGGAWQV